MGTDHSISLRYFPPKIYEILTNPIISSLFIEYVPDKKDIGKYVNENQEKIQEKIFDFDWTRMVEDKRLKKLFDEFDVFLRECDAEISFYTFNLPFALGFFYLYNILKTQSMDLELYHHYKDKGVTVNSLEPLRVKCQCFSEFFELDKIPNLKKHVQDVFLGILFEVNGPKNHPQKYPACLKLIILQGYLKMKVKRMKINELLSEM